MDTLHKGDNEDDDYDYDDDDDDDDNNNNNNKHIPVRVINDNGSTVMSDIPIITDRQILVNRPDTALHDKIEKICLLIDIAILDEPKLKKKNMEN